MAMTLGRKMQIGLPPFHEKKLLVWGFCTRHSKTAMAQNIIQSAVKNNLEYIEMMLDVQARDWGVSPEEAEARILKSMKYDPTAAEISGDSDD